jgi:hypothetical protein
MPNISQFIHGKCLQLLFSPKGSVEGVLLKMRGAVVQVSVPGDQSVALAQAAIPGRQLRLLALPDQPSKTDHSTHKVFKFQSFADATGAAISPSEGEPDRISMKGVVTALHYARHGEANGVILDTGAFIHLRPHGMVSTDLDIGSKVNATGTLRMTMLGTRMLEAHRVNNVDIA